MYSFSASPNTKIFFLNGKYTTNSITAYENVVRKISSDNIQNLGSVFELYSPKMKLLIRCKSFFIYSFLLFVKSK